jgi:outer membrane protein assembly factor BamB
MAHIFALLLAVFQAVPAPLPLDALDARWVATFDSLPAAPPGFDATTAYVPLKGDEASGIAAQLVAVDLDRGTIRWQLDVATLFTPATGEGLVFTVTGSQIEARHAETGDVKWQAVLTGGAAAPLYWDTGWLIASTTAGDLAAFRAADGTLIWRRELGSPLVSAPGPALDRLFLPLADNRLVALTLATGETIWERKFAAPVAALLALDDQLVFGTTSKDMTSIDLSRGRERWTRRLGGDMAGRPAADEKHIYFAARDNTLRALDRKSGNMRWKATLASRPAGGPLRLGDALLMPLVSNQILGFDPLTGKPSITAAAAGEIGLQPYVRRDVRRTLPQLITVSREGQLQGFGRRFEPVPQPLADLPGSPAVP